MPERDTRKNHAGPFQKQFKSRTARRRYTRGHGLKAMFPPPVGHVLQAGTSDYCHLEDEKLRLRYAGLARKILFWGPGYGTVVARRWSEARLRQAQAWHDAQFRYRMALAAVWAFTAELSGGFDETFGSVYHTGDVLTEPFTGVTTEILSCQPDWAPHGVHELVWDGLTTWPIWATARNGRYFDLLIQKPFQTITLKRSDEATPRQIETNPEDRAFESAFWKHDEEILPCNQAMQALLYGRFEDAHFVGLAGAPWKPPGDVHLPPKLIAEVIGALADIMVEQGIIAETLIQETDLENDGTGGPGGVVGDAHSFDDLGGDPGGFAGSSV